MLDMMRKPNRMIFYYEHTLAYVRRRTKHQVIHRLPERFKVFTLVSTLVRSKSFLTNLTHGEN